MKVVKDKISIAELQHMSEKMFGRLVKAVVDIEQNIMAVDAELHADEEGFLLEEGSKQENLWGINILPDKYGQDDFIIFDSMMNIRPSQGNKSYGVNNPEIQGQIREIVNKLVTL